VNERKSKYHREQRTRNKKWKWAYSGLWLGVEQSFVPKRKQYFSNQISLIIMEPPLLKEARKTIQTELYL